MSRLSAIIVDDEMNARENLSLLIQNYCPELKVVATAPSVDQAKIMIESHRPDVVFLDSAMPTKDGFTLLDEVKEQNFQVVFTTAHSEYALKAFKADALDYIEKPIDIEALQKASSKAAKYALLNSIDDEPEVKPAETQVSTEQESEKLAVPTRSGYIFIENKEIVYMKANENYTEIILESGKKIISSKTIKRYEEKMNRGIFCRIHRSYIINKHSHLKSFSRTHGSFVTMSNGHEIPISRRRLKDFLNEIK